MKFSLKKSGRKRQEAIREAVRNGVSLAGMLAAAATFTAGCAEKTAPAIDGDIAVSESRQPATQGDRAVRGKIPAAELQPAPTLEQTPWVAGGPTTGFILHPASPLVELPKETTEYIVQKGDTLTRIARRQGTTLAVLKGLNQFSDEDANRLKVGQKLLVPKKQEGADK